MYFSLKNTFSQQTGWCTKEYVDNKMMQYKTTYTRALYDWEQQAKPWYVSGKKKNNNNR